MSKRAERRAQLFRIRDRALRIVRKIWRAKEMDKWAIENAEHFKECSCHMCCNEIRKKKGLREHERISRQEKKMNLSFNEQLDEINEKI